MLNWFDSDSNYRKIFEVDELWNIIKSKVLKK